MIRQVVDTNINLKSLKKVNEKKLPNLLVEYHLCELIFRCESKYPKEFDECLNEFLNSNMIADTDVNQEQRKYFLNTISCRFNTFKCKSTFKYQQVKTNTENSRDESEFNLVLSLNHANPNMRANALEFILKKMNSSKDSINLIDEEFIREQIKIKFSSESSPQVR